MGREEEGHDARGHRSRSRSPGSDRWRGDDDAAADRQGRDRADRPHHSREQDRQRDHHRREDKHHHHGREDREHRHGSGSDRQHGRSADAEPPTHRHRGSEDDNERRRRVHESIEAWTGSRQEARKGSRDARHGSRDARHGSRERHHTSRDDRHSSPPRQHRKRSRSPSADRHHRRSDREAPAARARYASPPRSPLGRAGSSRDGRDGRDSRDGRDGRATRNRSPSPQRRHAGHHGAAPPQRPLPGPPPSDEPPAVGSIHQGNVHTIRPFGVFVAIDGYKRHVLIHHTQVADEISLTKDDEDDIKVKALEFAAPRGQRVYVKIMEVSPEPQGAGFRVHGSMRAVSQQDGTDLDPNGLLAMQQRGAGGGGPLSEEPPEENSIHRAMVKKVEAYGIFVALDGYKKHGLVHSSQVSNYLGFSAEDTDEEKRAAMLEVVAVGDVVWVKVVEVSDDGSGRGPRIGCSIKLVNQTDGQDLDPMGSRYKPRGEGGGGGRGRGAPIGADAGEVGRGGQIDWGYLKADTKQYDGRQYDLLDEDAPPVQRGGADAGPSGRPAQQQGTPSALPPIGRGRGAVVPAWMTSGGPGAPAAPGSGTPGASTANGAAAAGAAIGSVEEALAILKELKSLNKHKKSKKHKKHKKHKHGKKEGKHSRRSASPSSSSGGSSGRSR